MGLHITLLRDLDGKFEDMMKLKKLCEASKVSLPPEVRAYFGPYADESEEYLRLEMATIKFSKFRDGSDCLEIDVSQLPPETKTIRATVSY